MPSIGGPVVPVDPNALASGESTIRRHDATLQSITMTSQLLRLSYFTALKTETVSSIRVLTGSTGAAATPSLVRLGLYTVAANGDIALVASTPSDTSLLASTTTAYTKALSVAYAKVAGQRYAVGALVVTAATAPTLVGLGVAVTSESGVAPKLGGSVSGQADLPASVVAASITDSGNCIYAALVP